MQTLQGQVIGRCYQRHRQQEFLKFLRILEEEFPGEVRLHLVMDHYGTHKHATVRSWLKRHPRFVMHFVPTSSSWLNLVERWFGQLDDKAIRRVVFRSVDDLKTAIEAFLIVWNKDPNAVCVDGHCGVHHREVAIGYSGQQEIERVFRGLKEGDWLGWGPMDHWTDRKIPIHAFYCMLGISLLQHLRKQAQSAWNGISTEQLPEELRQIQQFALLYPPQGEKGPNRVATVLSKQTLSQQALAKTLGLDHAVICRAF